MFILEIKFYQIYIFSGSRVSTSPVDLSLEAPASQVSNQTCFKSYKVQVAFYKLLQSLKMLHRSFNGSDGSDGIGPVNQLILFVPMIPMVPLVHTVHLPCCKACKCFKGVSMVLLAPMAQVLNNPLVPVNQLIIFVLKIPMVSLVPVVHTTCCSFVLLSLYQNLSMDFKEKVTFISYFSSHGDTGGLWQQNSVSTW